MKNYIQPGNTMEFTAPAALVSGQGVQIGQLFGVAVGDAANAERFSMLVEGVVSLNKNVAQSWAEGALLYWDGTEVTTVPTANLLIGVAAAAALAADATGPVRLNGIGRVDG